VLKVLCSFLEESTNLEMLLNQIHHTLLV